MFSLSAKVFRDYRDTLLRGRALNRDEPRSPVSLSSAKRRAAYYPGQDRLKDDYGFPNNEHWVHSRLAADTYEGWSAGARHDICTSARPSTSLRASYIVKTSLPLRLAETVRRAVLASDPNQPVSRVRPVEDDMRASIATQRFTMLIASLFAGLALMLAAIGTFGVMSHVVRSRTREVGVRIALGATRGNIVALVMGRRARCVASSVIGIAAAPIRPLHRNPHV